MGPAHFRTAETFMTPKRFMIIAGEASGDMLAAELVRELRAGLGQRPTYSSDPQPLEADLAPRFFGAGGPRMAEAGVELIHDLTAHSVVGVVEVLKHYRKLQAIFKDLLRLAAERKPDVIICVDFGAFNLRFARAIKQYIRARRGLFFDWNPRIIQYVSPQVWASREQRAYRIAENVDLLLSIFPFEKAWYAVRVPRLHVEFVGHPMLDRHLNAEPAVRTAESGNSGPDKSSSPSVLLLPGSRQGGVKTNLPIMLGAWARIKQSLPAARATMILPNETLAQLARSFPETSTLNLQIGGLAGALARADIALSSTGTITMECALFAVPAVTMFKASWITYQIGRRLVTINSMTMPNILAGEPLFPEFIQHAATPENLSRAALELLRDEPRRRHVQSRLREIIATLGGPGASRRAAHAILSLLP